MNRGRLWFRGSEEKRRGDKDWVLRGEFSSFGLIGFVGNRGGAFQWRGDFIGRRVVIVRWRSEAEERKINVVEGQIVVTLFNFFFHHHLLLAAS